MSEKCYMSWPKYSDHLKLMLHELKNDESGQDVTLVCEDKVKLRAHQIVLKACSLVFATMLEGMSQQKTVIFLRGIKHQELETILQFMYLGEATLLKEKMNEFLKIAKILEVKELFNLKIKINEEDHPIDTPPGFKVEEDEHKSTSELTLDVP